MTVQEEINMLRRSVLIHSCLYYKMDSPILDDKQYDAMARKLDAMHKCYPEIAETCVYQEAFKDFSPATGFDLPLDDEWVVDKAFYLYRATKMIQIQEKISKKMEV
jgi:hypothetical protein